MTEYSHQMLVRGHYQVVALSQEPDFDADAITGYAVVSSSGARLRYEVTLEQARLWVDQLIEDEELRQAEPRPAAKAIRRRR